MYFKTPFKLQSGPSENNVDVADAFSDVAGVLTLIFHDLDLVPSDIAAGLLLMHLRHKRHREESRRRGSVYRRRLYTEAVINSENVLTSSPTVYARDQGFGRAEFSPSAVSVPLSTTCSPTNGDNFQTNM